MNYWSTKFVQSLYSNNHFGYHIKSLLNTIKNKLEKKQVDKFEKPRSKIEIVFEQYLISFGYVFQSNVKIGFYEVDFLIGDRIVLELNGNHHYCSNDEKKLHFRDRFKNHILEKNGYLVVNMSINDWIVLMRDGKRSALEKKFTFTCNLIENKYVQYLQKL